MEKKYLIKSILIRIICIFLLLFSIRIWRINIDYYIGRKKFFDSYKAERDYFDSKKEALKPEVQYVDNTSLWVKLKTMFQTEGIIII